MNTNTPSTAPAQDTHQGEAPTEITPPQAPTFTLVYRARIELSEDDPEFGTYWKHTQVQLGEYASFEDALAAAEKEAPYIAHTVRIPETLRIKPIGLVIRDSSSRLALAGWLTNGFPHLVWAAPVTCDAEEHRIRSEVSERKHDARLASSRDNSYKATMHRRHAERFDAHLVDPLYRVRVAEVLKERHPVITAAETLVFAWWGPR